MPHTRTLGDGYLGRAGSLIAKRATIELNLYFPDIFVLVLITLMSIVILVLSLVTLIFTAIFVLVLVTLMSAAICPLW